MQGIAEPTEDLVFYYQVELVKSFYYSENRLSASGGSDVAVTAKIRIE